MQEPLPETFRPLLWSYDFNRMDPERNRKTIIVQAINYGILAHWRWLVQRYGRDALRQLLTAVPATGLRPQARQLASLIFGIERFNYAPRGTD
jgi:hypothetical protein